MSAQNPSLTDSLLGYTSDAPSTPQKILIGAVAAAIGAVNQVTPPASATASGVAGQFAFDANYFYTCPATNTWVRCPLASWT